MIEPPLVRPSKLARFWGLHPRTVYTWIREGRLAAMRSPGNQFRVRVADVRALCEREGLPMPPFLAPQAKVALVACADDAERRALRRSLKGAARVDAIDDPYEALFTAVRSPPELFVLRAAAPRVDVEAAIRALRAIPDLERVPILAFDAASATKCAALERAGATVALGRSARGELAAEALRLLGSA